MERDQSMSKEFYYPVPGEQRMTPDAAWNQQRIKALRKHMGMTQAELAEEMQVRQQTISDWEQGHHIPHRSTQRMLSLIAERAGFDYQVNTKPTTTPDE